MAADREHPIDSVQEAFLRKILRIDEDDAIPERVVDMYFRYKAPADGMGYRLSPGDLITIVILAGEDKSQAKPYSFYDVARDHPVKFGDQLTVMWRGQKRSATFSKFRANKVVVLLDDGSSEERRIDPAEVWFPE